MEAINAKQALRISQLTNFQKQMQKGFTAVPARPATPPPPKPEWYCTGQRYPLLDCEIWYSAEPEILQLFSMGGNAARAPCRFAVKWGEAAELRGIDEMFLTKHERQRYAEAGEGAKAALHPQSPAAGGPTPAKRSIQPTIVDSLKQMPGTRTPAKTGTPKRRRSSVKRRRPERRRSPRAAEYSSEEEDGMPSGI